MAYRLKFSTRALRETGQAQDWYEAQSPGLGEEFIAAMELQLLIRHEYVLKRRSGLARENPVLKVSRESPLLPSIQG